MFRPLQEYQALIDKHLFLVNFFATDMLVTDYYQLIPQAFKCLEKVPVEILCRVVSSGYTDPTWPKEINDYISTCFSMRIAASIPTAMFDIHKDLKIGMDPKKIAEVQALTGIINDLCKETGVTHILDLGSGFGYLSSVLSLQLGHTVVGMDSSSSQIEGAIYRLGKVQKLYEYHGYQSKGSLRFVEHCVSSENLILADLVDIAGRECGITSKDSWIIIGLHTCGDLSSSIMRSFSECQDSRVTAIINVGCCYHRLTEKKNYNDGYPLYNSFHLGNRARYLACQATGRWETPEVIELQFKRLFYRSVFQKMLQDSGYDERTSSGCLAISTRKTGMKQMVDPIKYVQSVSKQVGVNLALSDDDICRVFLQFRSVYNEIAGLWTLRTMLADAVENIIILDRRDFLINAKIDVRLHRFIDARISPRNVAFIALKTTNSKGC